ncbi:MAG: hypothetical protein ACREJO_03690 [Phycisphaerales bacterium]
MSPTVLRQPKPKSLDLSDVAKASRSFFTQHKLDAVAKAVPTKLKFTKAAEEIFARAGQIGMEPTLVLPPVKVQHEQLANIARGMAASPCEAIPAELQYAEPWIADLEALKAALPRSRPAGAYVLCMAFGAYEEDTANQSARQIDKLFEEDEVTGLTVPEFMLVQRLRAVENGDHRFADATPMGSEQAGWQWLLDTRSKDGVAAGYWNAGKRRIEVGWVKAETKSPRRGAHRTLIIECV